MTGLPSATRCGGGVGSRGGADGGAGTGLGTISEAT